MTAELASLEPVNVREAWPHEALDFTAWLARPENLGLLGDALGMELELEGTEVRVGPYRADIVATDGGDRVLIENQFEKSDHDHLGKLLVYASGLDAARVVWICEELTEEHRQALDWLNENTRTSVAFFAVLIELWRIGDSLPAPRFDAVVVPNSFQRSVDVGGLSETEANHLAYWTSFVQRASEDAPMLRPSSPAGRSWLNVRLGTSGFQVGLSRTAQGSGRIGCELYIEHQHSKEAFRQLHERKDEIEDQLGSIGTTDWRELPTKHASSIQQVLEPVKVDDEAEWEEQHRWLMDRGMRFIEVFAGEIRALDLSGMEIENTD